MKTPEDFENDDEGPGEVSSSAISAETVLIGVRGAAGAMLSRGSDFPGKKKSMVLDIEYPIDYGDALTLVFKELRKYGIITKAQKESHF